MTIIHDANIFLNHQSLIICAIHVAWSALFIKIDIVRQSIKKETKIWLTYLCREPNGPRANALSNLQCPRCTKWENYLQLSYNSAASCSSASKYNYAEQEHVILDELLGQISRDVIFSVEVYIDARWYLTKLQWFRISRTVDRTDTCATMKNSVAHLRPSLSFCILLY